MDAGDGVDILGEEGTISRESGGMGDPAPVSSL